MPSTYSSNLKIELQATGENSNTWGTITNTNLGTALEQAIVGYGNPNYASDANLTLTYTDTNAAQAARALVLNVTSGVSLSTTRELIVPTIQKQYIVQNNTTGSQSITVKTSAGTGITVPNGRKAHLYVNGTDVIYMDDYVDINGGAIDGTPIGANSASTGSFTTLATSSTVTVNGGTANQVQYLNASKQQVGSASLTFDGTTLATTTVDATNVEVTNVKAKDGTAAIAIADSTGAVTVSSGSTLNGGVVINEPGADVDFRVESDTDTHCLFVDASANAVGIGTASPGTKLHVTGSNGLFVQFLNSQNNTGEGLAFGSGSSLGRISTNGASTAMAFEINAVEKMRLDSSGNLGLGVTPSAWGSARIAIDIGSRVAFGAESGYPLIAENAYNSGGGSWVYKTTGYAGLYEQRDSSHQWYTAPSGTAGNAITFTQAMTLDSSGRLGIGETAPATTLNVGHKDHGVGIAYINSSTLPSLAGSYTTSSGWGYGYGDLILKTRTDYGGFYNIIFATASSNNTPVERARITSDGNFGVGTTSPLTIAGFTTLEVKGSSAGLVGVSNNSVGGAFGRIYTSGSTVIVGTSTNHPLVLDTNDTERARITAAGKLLVNDTTSRTLLDKTIELSGAGTGTGQCGIFINQYVASGNPINTGYFNFQRSASGTLGTNTLVASDDRLGMIRWLGANGTDFTQAAEIYAEVDGTPGASNDMPGRLVFATTANGAGTTTERARITSGGDLLVGRTAQQAGEKFNVTGDVADVYLFRFFNDGNNSNRYGGIIQCGADDASGTNYSLAFDDGDGTRQGQITFSGGTTTYGTSSDYRLKENIRPIDNATARLAQLKPCKWEWKRNGRESEGFVAHELQEVVPIAVAGEKDEVDANGNPMYQSVGAANVVPLLTAALQEAMARIEKLEAEVAALKGA